MKPLWKSAVAMASGVAALHAHAALTFSESVAGLATYVAPVVTTPSAATAYVATDSVSTVRLAPPGNVASFLVLAPSGSATIDVGEATTFSFLWGSPDLFNSIAVATTTGVETFTGLRFQTLFGLTADGSNASTRLVTITAGANQLLNSITFASSGTAFELAVAAPVPEPQNYALLLAGLLIVVFVSRRTGKRNGG